MTPEGSVRTGLISYVGGRCTSTDEAGTPMLHNVCSKHAKTVGSNGSPHFSRACGTLVSEQKDQVYKKRIVIECGVSDNRDIGEMSCSMAHPELH